MRRLVAVGTVYPLAMVASLYHLWLAGRYALGWWPRPSLDDPKVIAGAWYEVAGVVFVVLCLGLLPVFVGTVTLAILAWQETEPSRRTPMDLFIVVVCPMIVWVAAVAFFVWDPAHVLSWMLD